jgi:hypothetical protein
MKTKTCLCAAALPFLLLSCTTLTHEHIKSHQWFHGQGYSIGNRLSFDDKAYSIRKDITIQSLATGEEGLYHEK